MTPEQFCYWLQGYMELTLEGTPETPDPHPLKLTDEQVTMIYQHLRTAMLNISNDIAPFGRMVQGTC